MTFGRKTRDLDSKHVPSIMTTVFNIVFACRSWTFFIKRGEKLCLLFKSRSLLFIQTENFQKEDFPVGRFRRLSRSNHFENQKTIFIDKVFHKP